MKLISVESRPFHEIIFKSSYKNGKTRICSLPFYKAKVKGLPKDISSFVAVSDLQGRELGATNRLLGEVLAEELLLLQEKKEIPEISLILLAGDLYDHPNCNKLGSTGDVTIVFNSFAKNFEAVVGVLGNHDIVQNEKLADNVKILDISSITHKGLSIGGISGIIGKTNKNQRKDGGQFVKGLSKILSQKNHIVLLHQGPDDLIHRQIGEPVIREILEEKGSSLIIFGHCHWDISLITIGNNQVLNVDSRLFLFEEQNTL